MNLPQEKKEISLSPVRIMTRWNSLVHPIQAQIPANNGPESNVHE